MKRVVIFLLLQAFSLGIIACENNDILSAPKDIDINNVDELRLLGLPLIVITTIDGEEPTCDYVDHPEGAVGQSITNATKIPGRCVIWNNNQCIYDSGDFINGESGITIKIRGNTSAYSEKKPYKLKLQKKEDLLFRNDPLYKDKDWVLLKGQVAYGDENDATLDVIIGNKISQILGMQWTPQCQYVNVMVNGDYRGVYILSETIKSSPGRINVDKKTGYIIEHDSYWWNEPLYFETGWGGMYTFKYPEADDITTEQIDFIKDKITEAENAMWADTYDELIDVNSFAAWLLAHDILGSSDGAGTNMYLTMYDNTPSSKIMMGPLWDFDGIMIEDSVWSACRYYASVYYHLLLKRKSFTDVYYSIWDNICEKLVPEMEEFLTSFLESSEGKGLQQSRVYDQMRWGGAIVPVDQNVMEALSWFRNRKDWMSHEFEIERSQTNLSTPRNDYRYSPSFDIMGRPLLPSNDYGNGKKIIIRQGKKFYMK